MHNVIIIYQMLDEDTRSVQYILNFILHYTVHCIIVGTLLYTDIHSVNQIVSHLLYSFQTNTSAIQTFVISVALMFVFIYSILSEAGR